MHDPNQLPIHSTRSHPLLCPPRPGRPCCLALKDDMLHLPDPTPHAGVITFVMWLSLRPHRPRFHVYQFSILSLAQASGFENAEITFNVTVQNPNQHIGVYFDALEGTVYYRDQKVGSRLLLFPFYQPLKNTTVVADVLSGATISVDSQRWTEFMNDRGKGTVPFHLDVMSMIRFKVSTWLSQHHRMHATCDVSVGSDGLILANSKDKRCPVYFT